MLPDNTTVAFHVTSLDVIHSFWAYQLGVKADANPGQDNVAFTTTAEPRDLHRPLRRAVRALARRDVQLRARSCPSRTSRPGRRSRGTCCAANTKLLPPFAYTYIPDANGADGGYYPDNVDPYSKVETYGALPSPTQRAIDRAMTGRSAPTGPMAPAERGS